jgi:hypothetical protein
MFKKKKNSVKLSRQEALAAIPVVNGSVTVEELEGGDLLVTYPVTLRPILMKLSQYFGKTPQTTYRKLQLDRLGASVWIFLDGRHSVGQIIKKFAKTHKLHLKEAEVSVTQFLRILGQRGIIGLS